MRKSLKFMPLVCALGVVFAAGCAQRQLTENELKAIDQVMGGNVCTLNGATPIISGQTTEVEGDTNQMVQVVTNQMTKVGDDKITVDVEWTYKGYESDVARYRAIEGDEHHKNFEFNFPAKGAEAKAIEITATPSVAGIKAENKVVKFQLSLLAMKLVFPEWSIAETLKLNSDKSMFAHITNPAKGYFESNQDPDVTPYCYAKTYGEVVYLAPDGNWGLIADGDYWMEIYAGSSYNLNAKTYADLKVGNKVYVYGEPTNYKGNIQVSYISKIELMSDGSKVAAVNKQKVLDENYFKTTCQISQDMNRDVKTSGKFKSKSLTTDAARGTFVITVGSTDVTVAYDYHVAKEGSSTVFEEMMAVLNNAVAGTTVINVAGSLRWENASGVANVFSNSMSQGQWTIVPYLSGHVA